MGTQSMLALRLTMFLHLLGILVLHQSIQRTECQEGYDYAPPPKDVQLRPQGGGSSKPQADGGHGHGGSGDPLDWLRESVPGEPGVDYPIFSSPPDTGFTCDDKEGIYADVSAQCQAWHVCVSPDRQWSFLCPNGTIFNQEIFTCVWWFDFDCNSAENFYSLNDGLYQETGNSGAQFGGTSSGSSSRAPSSPSAGSRSPSSSGGSRSQASRQSSAAGGNRGGQRRPQGGSKASSSQGGGSRSPSTSTGSRLRPSGGNSRPQGGNSRSQGGSRRPQGVTAEPGLVLVIPGLEEEEELPGYGGYQADSVYGAPGRRKRRGNRRV